MEGIQSPESPKRSYVEGLMQAVGSFLQECHDVIATAMETGLSPSEVFRLYNEGKIDIRGAGIFDISIETIKQALGFVIPMASMGLTGCVAEPTQVVEEGKCAGMDLQDLDCSDGELELWEKDAGYGRGRTFFMEIREAVEKGDMEEVDALRERFGDPSEQQPDKNPVVVTANPNTGEVILEEVNGLFSKLTPKEVCILNENTEIPKRYIQILSECNPWVQEGDFNGILTTFATTIEGVKLNTDVLATLNDAFGSTGLDQGLQKVSLGYVVVSREDGEDLGTDGGNINNGSRVSTTSAVPGYSAHFSSVIVGGDIPGDISALATELAQGQLIAENDQSIAEIKANSFGIAAMGAWRGWDYQEYTDFVMSISFMLDNGDILNPAPIKEEAYNILLDGFKDQPDIFVSTEGSNLEGEDRLASKPEGMSNREWKKLQAERHNDNRRGSLVNNKPNVPNPYLFDPTLSLKEQMEVIKEANTRKSQKNVRRLAREQNERFRRGSLNQHSNRF